MLLQRVQIQLDFFVQFPLLMDLQTLTSKYCHLQFIAPFRNDCFNICHPWREFRMIELNQIMQHQGDNSFTKVLNRIREGSLDNEDFKILCARIVSKSDIDYPCTAMHIWPPVDDHNNNNYARVD